MKKTEIKQRVANAVDAFLAGDNSIENNLMTFTDDSGVRRNESPSALAEKTGVFSKSLKRGFLFFPGTFVLFIISFAVTIISTYSPKLVTVNKMPSGRMFTVFLFFAASVFMTWFGLGDWRKLRHCVIPASIIALGMIIGIVGGALSAVSPEIERLIFRGDNFPIYFFPLALIVSILAKSWVDMKDGN